MQVRVVYSPFGCSCLESLCKQIELGRIIQIDDCLAVLIEVEFAVHGVRIAIYDRQIAALDLGFDEVQDLQRIAAY